MWTVFDLDGCLSDDRPRRHLLRAGKYADYHALLGTDKPLNYDLWDNAQRRMVITTRPEKYRSDTLDWLRRHFRGDFDLLMRPHRDVRGSPELKVDLLCRVAGVDPEDVDVCYDDREDVIVAYRQAGYNASLLPSPSDGVPELLEKMAGTFRERNSIYGDNYRRVVPALKALFPNGTPEFSEQFYLMTLIVMKLGRFAQSGLTHADSIHDAAVYAAMLESTLGEKE